MKFVYVVKPDQTVERRNLETGPLSDGMRVTHSGLNAGEQVVSTRLQLLQPGMKVQPILAPPAEDSAPPVGSTAEKSEQEQAPPTREETPDTNAQGRK